MTSKELYALRWDWVNQNIDYQFVHHTEFKYEILDNITFITRSGRRKKGQKKSKTYNNCFIMFDTETSRKKLSDSKQMSVLPSGLKSRENHVVAWTISIRAFDKNIVTLWGHKPSTLCSTMRQIHDSMKGMITIFYAHNLPYDHWFLRQFLFKEFGIPEQQLNIKSHYPLYVRFANGIELRDSLMLAQKSLEKWAEDLHAPHQKAVGKWNYTKFRNQQENFSKDELLYIEHDTLAGVECLDITMQALGKRVYSMPFTATGIPRDDIQRIGKEHNAKELFLRLVPTFEQYIKLTKLFHGGFTHANRFMIDVFIDWTLVQCYDFCSSYPFCMLAYKYPMETFHKIADRTIDDILKDSESYAFMFKLIGYGVKLKKPDHVMPGLQFSKCVPGTCINPTLDNGRILECDYMEIYLNEVDLEVIAEQYSFEGHTCVEVECALKDYLPRWFTDYIFELFKEKSGLSLTDDYINYMFQKGKINSCYGMCVQRSIRELIKEVYKTVTDEDGTEHISGEYEIDAPSDPKKKLAQDRKEYNKYVKKQSNVLLYQHGVWVTSYAFRNVHRLNKCIKREEDGGLLLYNDTDSAYAAGWDPEKIKAYNDECLRLLRANGYDSITIEGKTFTLGIAEHKELKDDYTEFKVLGAKRYAGRCKKDNKLHITVAGVPKKKGALTLNDDLMNFTKGHIFKGTETGKKTHVYFHSDIYIDDQGNETADSIDLLPCDYKLDPTKKFELSDLLGDDVEVVYYDED